VAQPEADHVVDLTEVYRVSPSLPLQTYRFGNWTPGGGLTWPSRCFYHRRSNLLGLTLKTGFKLVCIMPILRLRKALAKLLSVAHEARFVINFSQLNCLRPLKIIRGATFCIKLYIFQYLECFRVP
jgi:hypothetical protein